MCFQRIAAILACCCLLATCSAQADTAKTVQDINAIADTVNQVVQSPAGDLIPEPVRTVLLTITTIVGCLVSLWFKKGKRLATQALTAVAQGIEESSPIARDQVKGRIAEAMEATDKYEQLNKVVDSVK